MTDVCITNACIVDPRGRQKGDFISIEGGRISFVGKAPSNLAPRAKVIDAGGRCVVPGLINCHTHLYSSLAFSVHAQAKDFLEVLKKLWWRWDLILGKDDIYASALIGTIECLKSGVTTIFDHHASYGFISGSLKVIAKALSEAGLRGSLCFETSDRNGTKKRDLALRENSDFLSSVEEKNGLLSGMIGLHASFTLSDDALRQAAYLAGYYDTGVHVHLCEDEVDAFASVKKFGKKPLARFEKFGLVSDKAIFAHGIHVDLAEVRLLAKRRALVVHNPYSNLGNGVGIMNFAQMMNNKIRLGFGTDGFGQNPAVDARLASVMHRRAAKDSGFVFSRTADALLQKNAEFASRAFGQKLGLIEKGYAADLVIRDICPVRDDIDLGELFYRINFAPAKTVVINGKVAMRDFKVLGVDEREADKYAADSVRGLMRKWR